MLLAPLEKMSLNKLRNFFDQIDHNFDEVLSELSKVEQEKVLKKFLRK